MQVSVQAFPIKAISAHASFATSGDDVASFSRSGNVLRLGELSYIDWIIRSLTRIKLSKGLKATSATATSPPSAASIGSAQDAPQDPFNKTSRHNAPGEILGCVAVALA